MSEESQKQVDAIIRSIVDGLGDAVSEKLKSMKVPATPGLTLVVSMTLLKIGIRLSKQNKVPIEKFMSAVEQTMKMEFARGEEVPTVVTENMGPDGQPLIILGH